MKTQKEINLIIQYEEGDLDDKNTLELFSVLIKNGHAWTLQGHYGRTAKNLIDNDLINSKGVINWDKYDELITI